MTRACVVPTQPRQRRGWTHERCLRAVGLVAIQIASTEIAAAFVKAASLAGILISLSDIEIQELCAPHRPPSSLPAETLAVYVFMFGQRCLKVGKVGKKSAARFCSQHYGAKRVPSILARSLIEAQARLGISGLDEGNVTAWICEHLDRVNFLIPEKYSMSCISLFETFVHCRLSPEFEGFASQRTL
jgi:hypothetical protein